MTQTNSRLDGFPGVRLAMVRIMERVSPEQAPAYAAALRERLDAILLAHDRLRQLDYRFSMNMAENARPLLACLALILGSAAVAWILDSVDRIEFDPESVIFLVLMCGIVVRAFVPDRSGQREEIREAGGRLHQLVRDLGSLGIDASELMDTMRQAVPIIAHAADLQEATTASARRYSLRPPPSLVASHTGDAD